ncbi:hypothetical protein MRX96_004096 [Rhipicephalus microplus]
MFAGCNRRTSIELAVPASSLNPFFGSCRPPSWQWALPCVAELFVEPLCGLGHTTVVTVVTTVVALVTQRCVALVTTEPPTSSLRVVQHPSVLAFVETSSWWTLAPLVSPPAAESTLLLGLGQPLLQAGLGL